MAEKRKIVIDPQQLTLGEIEDVEQATGKGLSDLFTTEAGGLLVMVFVEFRRTDPTFTWEQARAVKFSDIDVDRPSVAPKVARSGRSGGTVPTPAV